MSYFRPPLAVSHFPFVPTAPRRTRSCGHRLHERLQREVPGAETGRVLPGPPACVSMCSRHLRARRVCRAETWPGARDTRTPFFCLQPRTTLTCKAARARSAGSGVRLPFPGGGWRRSRRGATVRLALLLPSTAPLGPDAVCPQGPARCPAQLVARAHCFCSSGVGGAHVPHCWLLAGPRRGRHVCSHTQLCHFITRTDIPDDRQTCTIQNQQRSTSSYACSRFSKAGQYPHTS